MEENIITRMAMLEELDEVRTFLAPEWNLNRKYFEQFHVLDGEFLFVIGKGEVSGEIYGCGGLIITNRSDEREYQLVLLYVPRNKNNFHSITLINYILNEMNSKSLCSCGVRKKVLPICKWFNCEVGKMKHYYKLNHLCDYKIAEIKEARFGNSQIGNMRMVKIENIKELKNFNFERYRKSNPYKDFWCIKHRYVDEEIHKYNIYKIVDNDGTAHSLIIMREVSINERKICKIVDFIGNDYDISQIGQDLDQMMIENNYEYIDFYLVGIEQNIMERAGFVLLEEDDENIIPHYTEPLLKINKDIYYFTSKSENFHIYIGDCDQDRGVYGYIE